MKLLKNKFFVGFAVVALSGAGWYFYSKTKASTAAVRYVTAPVTKGTITSSVSGTGQVSASDELEIKPDISGKVISVNVKEGQAVKAGDILLTLDSQTALNQVNQAKVSLMQAQASYDKLVGGPTSNDLAQSDLSVKSAQQALDKAKRDYDNTVATQQQAVDKAYTTLLNDNLEAVASDNITTATVELGGSYAGKTEGQYKISLYQGGDGTYYSATGLGSVSGLIKRGFSQPLGNGLYITFSTTGTLFTNTTWTVDVPNKRSGSYLTNLNSYASAQQSQKQALASAQNTIYSAENSLEQANLQKSAKTAPAEKADLAAAQAQIASARVSLSKAGQDYQNTIIRAPFDGVVAKLDVQKGDQAGSGAAVATLITQQKVAQITLNEVDAVKVKTGQKAALTFSAIDGLTISGQVGQVDVLGTVTQNVVNFSAKIYFDTQDDRVKPGMSASVAIITDVKTDVLTVPSAAVKSSNGNSYVQVLVNGQPQQKAVTVGINSDTETEISGDVKEGEEVVTQTINSSAQTQAQNQTRTNGGGLIPGLGGGNATFRSVGGTGVGR